jgi:hypothetical protein
VRRQPSITADSPGSATGVRLPSGTATHINGALVRCRVQPVIDKADKTLGFTTAGEGVDAILGHYLCAMLGALADGTWGRLKACWNEVSPGVLRPLAQPRRYVVRDGDLRQRAQDTSAPRAEARRLSPSRDPSAVAIDRTPGSSQASRLPPAVSKTRSAGPSAELTSPAPWWRASWTAKFRASRARSSETWASYWAGSSERHPTARAVAARAVADKKAHRHRRTHRAGEGSSNRA